MKNKTKDPYPITDVYHVTDTLVDAATVVVTDLCENLSNSIDTHCDDILEHLKKINTKKFNSISVGNSADGIYPVWIGVDKFNKVRKIFANTNGGRLDFDREKTKKFVSWSWDKSDLNDQFFSKSNKNKNVKRQRLFDMEIKSGAIAIADHGGHFGFEHHDAVIEALNEKYFKINNIYQNNYPIGLFIFNYGNKEVSSPSSFKSSKIHDEKVVNISDFKSLKYTEFISNLLDEKCYPTKYIFEKYLVDEKDYEDKIQIKISDEKISGNYLSDRLPKALQILKKQNKILFGKNFKEVHEIRKSQFENFIISIIRDIEPQELNLPTFGKKESKPEVKNNKLYVETPGLPYVQETFYDGYKLKSEPSLLESATIPVKNGKYPCYIHSFPDEADEADEADEDGYQYNNVYVVLEGLENCYLNRNSKGQIFFDKSFKESLFLREHINKKSKKISIDKIDLRKSENLKELEKISFVEEIELHGFKNIKSWDGLSKLKKLKRLKLVSCDVSFSTTENFFKNLYSLTNLEEFTIDDTCDIPTPLNKKKFSKDLYFKKLKSFEIDFREEWKKTDHENYPNYKGYGNDKVSFISAHLPNIYNFPNFEKFKSLEKLRIYNYFDFDQKEGTLFNYEYGFEDYYQPINQLCKNSKIKDIWIYGYNFKQANELASTRFLDAALKLTKDTNVKINGINKSTLKNISEKPISSTSKKINKLILINKIDEVFDEKLISQENDAITLNYFSNLEDKENRGLLNDVLNQQIEEITIKPANQFFISENIYSDTLKPIEDHIKKNKKLRKIIFEFDGSKVTGHGDMDGSWGCWENEVFGTNISQWIKDYNNLEIIIKFDESKNDLKDLELKNRNDFEKFLIVFLIRTLQKNAKIRNRITIPQLDNEKIDKIISAYFKDKVNSIIVIGDNNYQKDNNFDDIEILTKSMFEMGELRRNAATVPISFESGDKNYSEFWSSFIENFHWYDGKNYIVEAFKHDWESHGDNTMTFVKESYLKKNSKVIFNNIRNYFYFAQSVYDDHEGFDKLYKQNYKLIIPNSIKFNKPEQIYISGGGKLKFDDFVKQVDVSELKTLHLGQVLHADLNIPSMPQLEKLFISHRANEETNNEDSITYKNFQNLPNLRELTITNILAECLTKNNKYKSQLAKLDLSKIDKLKKLKELSFGGLNYQDFPKLKCLKNIETFDLYNLDTDKNKVITHHNFSFLKEFKRLKKLSFDVSHHTDDGIIFDPNLFLNLLNKDLEDLKIGINVKNNNSVNLLYKNIAKKFTKIKKLDLYTNTKEDSYKNIDKGYSGDKPNYIDNKTGKKFAYEKGPNPFVFDIKIFENLKRLEHLNLSKHDANGYKIKSLLSVTKMKKLKQLGMYGLPEILPTSDLKKIKGLIEKPRDEFFNQCKRKNKKIKSQYDLKEKDSKKYDLLDRDIRFGWGYGDSIDDILKGRKKKKN